MENEKVIMTENDRFKDAAKKLNSMVAKEIARMAEHGHGDEDDFALAGLMCSLLTESVNVIENLEHRIDELSKGVNKLKK